MKKNLFVYNNQTLQFEKHKYKKRSIAMVIGLFAIGFMFSGSIYQHIKIKTNPEAETEALRRELNQMQFKYTMLNETVANLNGKLQDIQQTDANVHRLVFGMDPIDENIWNGGVGGHDKYQDLTMYKNSGQLIKSAQDRVDLLSRQLDLQTTSMDTLLALAKDREQMFAAMPSIKPIREDKLARRITLLSGFGMRIHPVHKTPKMHKGLDFTANKNTPIYSTGAGVVERVEKRKTGYGHNITINHGYGFKTLYGHMSTMMVKEGDKVTKGQEIGRVGNTGTSTAPHLHYEVHLNGQAVDPINYCMDGLTAEEYQAMVESASSASQSFD